MASRQNETISKMSQSLNVLVEQVSAYEKAEFIQNDEIKTLEVKFTTFETDLARQFSGLKNVEKLVEEIQKSTETMAKNKDFLEHVDMLKQMVTVSNNTVESTIS